MNCGKAQAAFSASMDGDERDMTRGVQAHLETCARCRRFTGAAQRIRVAARLQVAEPVPDLVAPIMERVRAEAARPLRMPPWRVPSRRLNVRAMVAAALVGALIGAAVVSRGLVSRAPVLAQTIPQRIAEAALNLHAYRATFRVVEQGEEQRRFDVGVAFSAPERYRVDVHDLSDPNGDSRLVVNGSRWSLEGPDVCTAAVTTTCPSGGAATRFARAVVGRPPFDADAPMPTDIILPMTALAGSDRAEVTSEGSVAGRPAVQVGLSAQDAAPLFAFFEQAGSWRPLYPSDRVSLWLDRESWLPLRATVTAAPGQDRAVWAARNGFRESAGDVLLDVRLTSLSLEQPPASEFAIARGGTDEGFRDLSASELADAVGYEPLRPAAPAGLETYRFGRFAGAGDEAILSYADGLAWLKIRETRSYDGDSLFGNMTPLAEHVVVPGGGVAYYEPATERLGRRVAIHARGWDLFLESNLRREQLLAVAGSLAVRGEDVPAEWRLQHGPGGLRIERVSLEALERRAGFAVLAPSQLPPGYGLVAAELQTFGGETGAKLFYGRSGAEPEGRGIEVYEAPGQTIPPASGNDQIVVGVRGASGRWSPDQHQLEWAEDGVYLSVTAPGLDLPGVLVVAESLGRR